MSTPADDGGSEITAPVLAPAMRPHRAGTGAVVGFVSTLALTIVLLSFQGDEGDISSAPIWWAFIALAAVALIVTGLLLIVSRVWRRFGVGFVAGAIVALSVEAALFVSLFALTYTG